MRLLLGSIHRCVEPVVVELSSVRQPKIGRSWKRMKSGTMVPRAQLESANTFTGDSGGRG